MNQPLDEQSERSDLANGETRTWIAPEPYGADKRRRRSVTVVEFLVVSALAALPIAPFLIIFFLFFAPLQWACIFGGGTALTLGMVYAGLSYLLDPSG